MSETVFGVTTRLQSVNEVSMANVANTDYTPAPITTSTWSDSSSSTWSSTSSSAPAATSSASSSSSGSGKGCLAWPNGDQSYLGDYKTDKTSLIYTWGETAPSNAASLGFTFAPQLWGYSNENAFASTVVAGYAKYALFLNEPNEVGQSNIDATTAAGLWKQYMEPLKALGYQVGSAATSSNPNGMTWTQDFFTACNGGCNPDFVAVHWYDISADGFMAYVEQWHTAFNLPIWVTEFAYQDFNGNDQGDLATIQSFMGEVTAWMDQQDYVQYYCWFGAMLDMQNVNPLNTLMNPDGSPSDLDAKSRKAETGWLVLAACTLLTANRPPCFGHLYRYVTRPEFNASFRNVSLEAAVNRAAIIRETALKSTIFVGVPRVILSLAALHDTLDEDVKASLRKKTTQRLATPENIEATVTRGKALWDSIYAPHADKLHGKLGAYHPDFIAFIIQAYVQKTKIKEISAAH
ncbi:glycoside hydrolase family 128 protein [Lentinula edodes]|uniref:Glycoside hydrolase family 128 protein n=1 Tax=Lentinula edodes TaxID=5353 RepID=A0A1Q3E473_LENED|nr:glycoside hydrolase family 128 protein [Lentinula edodes]